jgi:uncharacterized protein YjbI with pentapeptide repeats
MQPISRGLSVALLTGCLIAAVAVAREQGGSEGPPCEGSYKGRTPSLEELEAVLHNHQMWWEESDRNQDDARRANLCQADLREADLPRAVLHGANLQGAVLAGANLQGAALSRVNLRGAFLYEADLRGASLAGANLQGADLRRADLPRTDLAGANLQWAHLREADLRGASLFEANLDGAHLDGAALHGAVYEPNPGKLPTLWTLANPRKSLTFTLTDPRNSLRTLIFHDSPAALIALREACKKAGMRTQERQLTYAIEHTKQLQA